MPVRLHVVLRPLFQQNSSDARWLLPLSSALLFTNVNLYSYCDTPPLSFSNLCRLLLSVLHIGQVVYILVPSIPLCTVQIW